MKTARQAAVAPERKGVLAVVRDQATLDRLQGVIRELQLDDELAVTDSLDAGLRRMRNGLAPRLAFLDIADLPAPISEIGAARAAGGADIRIIALGAINDVGLYRDLVAAGANDYLVIPPSRDALTAVLDQRPGDLKATDSGLGQVTAFIGSRGGVGTTSVAVGCAWILAEEYGEKTALLDLDLHFGTVALKLDSEPGGGLCEALESSPRASTACSSNERQSR